MQNSINIIYQRTFTALENGFYADYLFLDFSKAFDLVSHQLLFLKLSMLNIDRSIIGWIEHFLSGVPQGYFRISAFSYLHKWFD